MNDMFSGFFDYYSNFFNDFSQSFDDNTEFFEPYETVSAEYEPTTAPLAPVVFTTPAGPTKPTDEGTTGDANILFTLHNEKRALDRDTSPLTWSAELEQYAQSYADNYDCSGSLVHSGGPYGENLALGYGVESAVLAWYNEIKYYDYTHPGFSSATSHFTQVVWKSTTQLRCSIKLCGGSWGDLVIFSYIPPGNVAGQFPENVMPLAK